MKARPNQIPPPGNWVYYLVLAGRGWGKTRVGAEDAAHFAIQNPGSRQAIVAPSYADGRDTCVEGESGLLACIPSKYIRDWNRSIGELYLINNSQFRVFSAETPSKLRGPQHHRAWCDEAASWRYPETLDMLMFGLRLGKNPQVIVTSTPKPVAVIRDLVKDKNTVTVRGSTYDNADNLPRSFLEKIISKYEGTRLGRQELYAEVLDDLPGSLWQRGQIEATRWPKEKISVFDAAKMCMRIVVAVDPSVSSGSESDECGIVATGVMENSEGLVLGDESFCGTPHEWGSRAVALFKRFRADCIVAEVNNGGDMVVDTIRTVDPNVPVRKVNASRGKYVRAEPISALYEQARIHHVGYFPKLEDQMCMFVQDVIDKDSPDRADALVWGLTELFDGVTGYGVLQMAKEDRLNKISQSGMMKPTVAQRMPKCPTCEKTESVVRVAGLFRCSTCSLVFGGSTLQIPYIGRRDLAKLARMRA